MSVDGKVVLIVASIPLVFLLTTHSILRGIVHRLQHTHRLAISSAETDPKETATKSDKRQKT